MKKAFLNMSEFVFCVSLFCHSPFLGVDLGSILRGLLSPIFPLRNLSDGWLLSFTQCCKIITSSHSNSITIKDPNPSTCLSHSSPWWYSFLWCAWHVHSNSWGQPHLHGPYQGYGTALLTISNLADCQSKDGGPSSPCVCSFPFCHDNSSSTVERLCPNRQQTMGTWSFSHNTRRRISRCKSHIIQVRNVSILHIP